METSAMQKQLDDLYAMQKSSEFGPARWAVFFAPGEYTLDVKVGYYTTVHGLGASPRNTTITGAVRSKAALAENNATTTFWRGVENLTVVPTVAEDGKKLTWATSQGTWLRRINVQGNVNLHDHNGWCSGGYISDSAVSGQIDSGSQQQYFIRNTSMGEFLGGAYAQVFVGCTGAPAEDWPAKPYSNTEQTPVVREKPYFIQDVNNGGDGDGDDGDDGGDDSKTRSDSHDAPAVAIVLPAARTDSQGPSWLDGDDGNEGDAVSTLSTWHVVTPDTFDVDAANKALATSQNVLFTPGVYNLSSSLQITQPDTTILGMGLATLKPLNGTPAITVADVDGATVAGVLLDAGENHSSSLLRVGDAKSFHRHDADPIVLNDVFFRVGGASPAPSHVDTMCVVNLRDTVIDHIWAWRGDHESGVGWNLNRCNVGLRVEADDVVAYALFVEHCNEYQTMWNGNKGRVFFYQSELPYDPPDTRQWSHSGTPGYASYKVAPSVRSHYATGFGIYCVFQSAPIAAYTAIEQPVDDDSDDPPQVLLRHVTIVRFGGVDGSGVQHVINGLGQAIDGDNKSSRLESVYEEGDEVKASVARH